MKYFLWFVFENFEVTRPQSVGHGYVFSMAVSAIGEWLKLVPFFVRGRTIDSEGVGGLAVFKNKYPCRQTHENKYSGLGP